ncbi:MAG TPA: DUF1592 domain-containing protein [Polyangiales bacterium]|nr:DUF1592 domain-containing protein [Polyangiales bacterium]
MKQFAVVSRTWTKRVSGSICGLMLAACTGSVANVGSLDGNQAGSSENPSVGSDSSDNKGVPGTGGGLGGTKQALCTTPEVAAAPMRRLTHREYGNAVRDLLGATANVPAFATDTQSDLFDTMADQHVSSLLADEYLEAAADLGEGISDVNALVGCAPAASSEACTRDFIARFGRRAYRRPLTSDEQARLSALYDSTRSASDAATGVRAVVIAVLASPHFLFRPEWGAGKSAIAGALNASPYELAARLSFLLWSSIPDETLLEAAKAGKLSTKAELTAQATRMLDDDRARNANYHFYEQWFGISLLQTAAKDASVYPSFNDGLRSSMLEETRRFVDHVVWDEDAKLATMLTASYSFVNKSLGLLYGVPAPSNDQTYVQTELNPDERSGVLTQASVLAAYAGSNESSPVKRGKWVRTRMLCQDLPAPPANVPALPEIEAGVSTRERFAQHTASPACASCHKLIDGLGFGLEHYDGIGSFRTKDQGKPVDASGALVNTDVDGTYVGGPELANVLANSDQVRDCAVTQWFRYSQGRREQSADACSLQALKKSFAANDGDLRQLLLDLVTSDSFTNYRAPG